jgi:phosphoglycerate dehydrogenase-like enzyme
MTDGSAAFPDFDLEPLRSDPRIDIGYVSAINGIVPPAELETYDALILFAYQMRRSSLPAERRLGLVARLGVGYDSVDVEALADEGVATVITPGGVARPVAVGILTLILNLAGKVFIKDELARRGPQGFAERSKHMGSGLTGKTVGSIGLGNIAAEMVRIMRPLGFRFLAHDPFVSSQSASELAVELVSLETVFRESDFVTVNCPLTSQTHGLVNAERLAMMKPTAFLINTARGPIVDQRALTAAIQSGRISGAGLDVFDPEPPAADDPLLSLDNVVLAPHSIAMTDELFARCGAHDIEAVFDVMHGREPIGIVDRRVTEHPEWKRRLDRNRKQFGDG